MDIFIQNHPGWTSLFMIMLILLACIVGVYLAGLTKMYELWQIEKKHNPQAKFWATEIPDMRQK